MPAGLQSGLQPDQLRTSVRTHDLAVQSQTVRAGGSVLFPELSRPRAPVLAPIRTVPAHAVPPDPLIVEHSLRMAKESLPKANRFQVRPFLLVYAVFGQLQNLCPG